jgi:hemerythrin-like domain-containing protein
MGKAIEDLRKEHDSIIRVLGILEKMISDDTKDEQVMLGYYGDLVYFLKIFADKCHHGKEEGYLFEELVKRGVPNEGGPVGEMLRDHRLGREYVAQMGKALELKDLGGFSAAAAKYVDLLRNHIEKENNVLFVMADRLLDDASQEDMFNKFEEHEESVIGHGVHEELHSMIHKWIHEFSGE